MKVPVEEAVTSSKQRQHSKVSSAEVRVEVPIYFEDLAIGDSFVTNEVTVDKEEMLSYNPPQRSMAISRR